MFPEDVHLSFAESFILCKFLSKNRLRSFKEPIAFIRRTFTFLQGNISVGDYKLVFAIAGKKTSNSTALLRLQTSQKTIAPRKQVRIISGKVSGICCRTKRML